MPAAERRASILTAARALFAERGYAATTTRAVAESAGVTEALIYRHFTSKRELLLTLVDGMIERFAAFGTPSTPGAADPPPDAILAAMGSRFAVVFAAESDLVLVVLSARAELGEDRRLATFIHHAATALGRRLQPDDPDGGYLLARSFMGAIASYELLGGAVGIDDLAPLDRDVAVRRLAGVFGAAIVADRRS